MALDAVRSDGLKRTLIEGALLTLGDPAARKGAAYQTARGILDGGKFSVRMDAPEPTAAQVAEVVEALHDVLPKLRSATGKFHGMHGLETAARKRTLTKGQGAGKCKSCGSSIPSPEAPCPGCGTLQEAPIAANATTPSAPSAAPPKGAAPKGPQQNSKAVGRTGKPVTGPSSPASGAFNEKHPRGQGGKFAQKGDGAGAGGPQPHVAQLQRRLRQLGYGPGAADGAFGPVTEGAVKQFQADYGLQQTGKVDPATAQVMQSPPAQKLPQIQAQNRAVAALPNAVGQTPAVPGAPSAAGAPSRSRSGGASANAPTLTSTSPAAVKAFQQAHGLTPDGVIGPQTLAALQTAPRSSRSSAKSTRATRGVGSPNVPGTPGVPSTGKGSSGVVGTGRHQVISQGAGMSGKPNLTVKTIQAQLTQLGYDLGSRGPDGKFGLYTEQAVRKLQREHGLKADGKIGVRTRRLIKRLLKHQSPKSGLSGDQLQAAREERQVSEVKRRLQEAVERRSDAERAGDASAFVVARAEEAVLRQRSIELQEFFGRGGGTVSFDPAKHPRGREGKFAAVLGGLKVGQHVKLPHGVEVHRTQSGFEVRGKGISPSHSTDVHKAVGDAMDAHDAKAFSHPRLLGATPLQRLQKAQKAEAATYALRHAQGSVADALCLRLEEASQARVAAAGNVPEALAARAVEVSVAEQIMEGKAISAHERAKYATVAGDKFPIPPPGHPRAKAHAKAALAYLNSAKPPLSKAQKDKVRAKAKKVLSASMQEAADTAAKAATHEPVGHGGKNWITKMGEQLPAYIQHIANDLIEKRSKTESEAVQMAIGIVKRWASGVGNVHAEVRAAAQKAVAEWEKLKAKNASRKVSEAVSRSLQEAMVPQWHTTGVEVEVDGVVLCETVAIEEFFGRSSGGFVAELHPRDRNGKFRPGEIATHLNRMNEGDEIFLAGSRTHIRLQQGAYHVAGTGSHVTFNSADAAAREATNRHNGTGNDTFVSPDSILGRLTHAKRDKPPVFDHVPFSPFGSLSPKVRRYYAMHPEEALVDSTDSTQESIDALQARLRQMIPVDPQRTAERQRLAGPVSSPVPGTGALARFQPGQPVTDDLAKGMPINALAEAIDNDWTTVSFAARPYLDAMRSMRTAGQPFGLDSGPSIISYFLQNAGGYQGNTASVIKRELKRRVDAIGAAAP